jgi:hypothetical protein
MLNQGFSNLLAWLSVVAGECRKRGFTRIACSLAKDITFCYPASSLPKKWKNPECSTERDGFLHGDAAK